MRETIITGNGTVNCQSQKRHKLGIAIHNYRSSEKNHLQLTVGEMVIITNQVNVWCCGYLLNDNTQMGLFPLNFVQIKPSNICSESISPHEDPISLEVVSTLHEWHHRWRQLYLNRNTELFEQMRSVMLDMIEWRRQLLSTVTSDTAKSLKSQIVSKIEWGNDILGLDFVPRVNYNHVNPDSMSILELHDYHMKKANDKSVKLKVNVNDDQKRHLLLHVNEFNVNCDDHTQIDFSLIDIITNDYISEKFCFKRGKVNRVIFTNITGKELTQLALCVQMWRFGKMIANDNRKITAQLTGDLKRAVACNLINVSELLKDNETCQLKLFEGDLSSNWEFLTRKQTNKMTVLQSITMTVSIKVMDDDSVGSLDYHGICLAQRRGFGDVIVPGHVRNDFYLTLENADFEKGGKAIPKNIETSICLITENGIHERAICAGANDERVTNFRSHVFYHQNSPKWWEQTKVDVPLDLFEGAHLRFEFRHCSSKDHERKLLGFSFLPLADTLGTCISDGEHELYIYKCDDFHKLDNVNNYLFIPWGPKDNVSAAATNYNPLFARSAKEACHVKTLLVSSKLTQNADLLSLLKWRANPEQVTTALNRVLRIPGNEMVKFLEDVLDSLFALFAAHDGTSTNHSGLVFKVLIHIFHLLEDAKFASFKHALDTYIESQFSAALVHRGLVSCVQQCAELSSVPEKRDTILRTMRVLPWLMKLIIQSRILYTKATGQVMDNLAFRDDLFSLFDAFNRVLSHDKGNDDDPTLISIQETLLYRFPMTYNQLIRVLNVHDLAKLVKTAIDFVASDHRNITKAKLNAILETVQCDCLWNDHGARLELMDTVVRQLVNHMSESQTISILRYILKHNYHYGNPRDIEMLSIGALDVIVDRIIAMNTVTNNGLNNDLNSKCNNNPEELSFFITCFVSLLSRMSETDFLQLFDIRSKRQRKDLLCQIFEAFEVSLIHFPKTWSVMILVLNHVILCSLQELCSLMLRDFIGCNFDLHVWSTFFSLAVNFLTQRTLQLELLSINKRMSIVDHYGDMRVLMGFQLVSCWEQLGSSKIQFIPTMVGPFLEVTLVPESELRRATIPIFYDMLNVEFNANGNFQQVECSLIDKLDLVVNSGAGDAEFAHLLSAIINDKLVNCNPQWRDDGHRLVSSLSRLLSLLMDYRTVMDADGDRLLMCTYALLRFYSDEIESKNRTDIMLRYIKKLSDLHLPFGNYAEAAFTLQLHANLLSWDNDFKAKEILYETIIDYFDRGKCWEYGVNICKELALIYDKSFNYDKLSRVLKTHARFLDNILTVLRPQHEYFRVGFFGLAFPPFLRNRIFIFRGLELERIGGFTQRMEMEFPSAQMMTKNVAPDESITQSNDQYIQIVAVKPIPEPPPETSNGIEIPENVLSYYNTNGVCKFIYDRPVQRSPFDSNNEFKSLWIERTSLTIEHSLPGVLRAFQVIDAHVTLISPLEYACETVESMNGSLSKLISGYASEGKSDSISPLSMRLQGVLDAAVNGGVSKYIDAFLVSSYLLANPSQTHLVSQLKSAIAHQVRILEGGLTLHGRLAPQSVQPLHRRLTERFAAMRALIQQSNHDVRPSILSQPLPPIPIEKIEQSQTPPVPPAPDVVPIYGQMMIDDNIYSVPQENPTLSRPRSAGFDNNNSNARVQRSRSIPRTYLTNHCLNNDNAVNSIKANILGPPLPPRASTLERMSPDRPPLPKRNYPKKCVNNDFEYKLIDIDIDIVPSPQSSSASQSPVIPNNRTDCDTNTSLLD